MSSFSDVELESAKTVAAADVLDLTILVVTSPSPVHPALTLVEAVLESVWRLSPDLRKCRVLLLADGYVVVPDGKAKPKKGRVEADLAAVYEEYLVRVEQTMCSPSLSLVRMPRHVGYSMAVKHGLEMCQTTFALILQHDRVFTRALEPPDALFRCLDAMRSDESIRYVGFPTITNNKHSLYLAASGLDFVNRSTMLSKQELAPGVRLQPLLFLYDSNHVAHIKRYL